MRLLLCKRSVVLMWALIAAAVITGLHLVAQLPSNSSVNSNNGAVLSYQLQQQQQRERKSSRMATTSPTHHVPPSSSSHRAGSMRRHSERFCNFSWGGGSWTYVGEADGGGGVEDTKSKEHILHWIPAIPACTTTMTTTEEDDVEGRMKKKQNKVYRRFEQRDALQCLQGKNILMYGNSNTRTLFIALESLLRNAAMTSRVAAKQRCDNSRTNHSCWVEIAVDGYEPIQMHYISYTMDLYHPQLQEKIDSNRLVAQAANDGGNNDDPLRHRRRSHLDIVVGNSGLNVIQLQDDDVFTRAHRDNIPKLRQFIDRFGTLRRKDGNGPPVFVWHKTTPVCPNQPHFRRYRYNAKHWRYRTMDQINKAVEKSNAVVDSALLLSSLEEDKGRLVASSSSSSSSWSPRVPLLVIDDWGMMMRMIKNDGEGGLTRHIGGFDLCPYFEDPLHHRFLDREVVQVLLNELC